MPEYEAYAAIAQAVYLAREEMSLDAAATLHGLIYGDEPKGAHDMNKTLAAAINEHIKPLSTFYPAAMSAAEHESMKRAEAEHAPGVAVRMNPNTFRIEYYRVDTGEVVSSHI